MKVIHKVCAAFLLLWFALLPTGTVLASGPLEGKVIFGQDFTLAAGETLNGDLAVFGGNVSIEEGATVDGSMAVIGGNATVDSEAVIDGDVALIGGNMDIAGSVNGDVAIIGGLISLAETAVVDGDIAKIGGQLDQAPGATITGEVTDNASPTINIPDIPAVPSVPEVPGPGISIEYNPLSELAGVVVQAIGVALVAALAALFLQPHLERVGQAVTGQPLIAGSFGLLMVTLGPLALVVIAVTLVLIPLSFLGFIALALGWLFGLIAIGFEVGERLSRAFQQNWAPPLAAGLGSLLLMLVLGLVGEVSCAGPMAGFLVGLVGLGGTALTVFGTRTYPRLVSPP